MMDVLLKVLFQRCTPEGSRPSACNATVCFARALPLKCKPLFRKLSAVPNSDVEPSSHVQCSTFSNHAILPPLAVLGFVPGHALALGKHHNGSGVLPTARIERGMAQTGNFRADSKGIVCRSPQAAIARPLAHGKRSTRLRCGHHSERTHRAGSGKGCQCPNRSSASGIGFEGGLCDRVGDCGGAKSRG